MMVATREGQSLMVNDVVLDSRDDNNHQESAILKISDCSREAPLKQNIVMQPTLIQACNVLHTPILTRIKQHIELQQVAAILLLHCCANAADTPC